MSHFYRFVMRRMNAFGNGSQPLIKRRARIDRLAGLAPIPRGATVHPVNAGGVPAEWDIPSGAAPQSDGVLLYIHGGAWVICSPRTHRSMVLQLARAAGIQALSIDYRLAPEHPFPAGLDDCVTAYRWLVGQGIPARKIVIGGDSAGGNLTLATLLALRDAGDPLPAAAVCLSPATDLTDGGETRRTRADVEVVLCGVSKGRGGRVVDLYAPGQDLHNPRISPLYGDLRGLPPILIHVGDHEILLDDSTRFVERACMARGDARVVVWPQMWHVFQMHAPSMPEARQSLQQLGSFICGKAR